MGKYVGLKRSVEDAFQALVKRAGGYEAAARQLFAENYRLRKENRNPDAGRVAAHAREQERRQPLDYASPYRSDRSHTKK